MKPGDFVHYTPASGFSNPENGRIKSINVNIAFVVYKCNDEWDRYAEYTGQSTDMSNLSLGWKSPDGKNIPDPYGNYSLQSDPDISQGGEDTQRFE